MNVALTCDFCAHRCTIASGGRGRCGVRVNNGGRLETTVRDDVQAFAVDPIEKKPLYHVRPGSAIASVALGGCNFTCSFCQNCTIAFADRLPRPRYRMTPDEAAAHALAHLHGAGAGALAFTYNEPAVWQDWLIEAARSFRASGPGSLTVMVTNGFLTREARDRLAPVIDAFNIDLKGDEAFYEELCGAHESPVLESIADLAGRRHVEVTTMIIEGRHTHDLLRRFARELARAGVAAWHLSRFFPAHEMRHVAPTSEQTLAEALEYIETLAERPAYLYAGNSRLERWHDTRCGECGAVCVRRRGRGAEDLTNAGECRACGARLPGIW